MKEEKLYCDHCGEEVQHFWSNREIGAVIISEKTTFEHQVHLVINRRDWNCDLCDTCVQVIRARMEKIFQNQVWREVDKVYETIWDCMHGQRKAA